LIPWLNQALGIPQGRVQYTTPSTLEELERMDTAGARPKSPPRTTSSRARSRDLVAAAAENRTSIPILKGLTTPIPALFPEVDTAAAPRAWPTTMSLPAVGASSSRSWRRTAAPRSVRGNSSRMRGSEWPSAESGMQADALLE
jgi:hypothetical protein